MMLFIGGGLLASDNRVNENVFSLVKGKNCFTKWNTMEFDG